VRVTELVRPYRGVSAEERRARRREQLLEACLDVVAATGVADTTAEAICARAGLSKRYFYESFADREGVLVAALDRLFEHVRSAITTELAGATGSAADRIERTVSALVAAISADPRSARLYVEAPRYPALEQRRALAFDEFTQLLIERVLDADPDDPRARIAALLVVAGTTEVLARWLAGDVALAEPEFVQTVAAIGLALASTVNG
jgi:AcrR family transcriptional regulator